MPLSHTGSAVRCPQPVRHPPIGGCRPGPISRAAGPAWPKDAGGATNQVAARKLLVSETTIKTHLLHIYTKLGVRDRASAVATAYKRGLIS
jgi:Bacterial regulatory proteins, luxR family